MSSPVRASAFFLSSAALVAALHTPAAAHSGPTMRMTGTMNQSMMMNRSGFMGGVGMMPFQRMFGTGGTMMNASPPAPAPMPMLQGGSGYSSPQVRSYYQPSSSAYGYDQPALSTAGTEAAPKSKTNSRLLALRRHDGGLDWPIALRYMTRDDDAKELRERIDARFEQLMSAKQSGTNAELLQALRGEIESVHKQFTKLGDDFPMTHAQLSDARSFLDKLRDALKQPVAASGDGKY